MPHTQCLGFLLGYTKKFVLYVIFIFWARDLKNAWVGLIVSGSFDIYKYSLPHICIYIKEMIIMFLLFYMVPTSGPFPPDGPVILLILACRSDTIILNA